MDNQLKQQINIEDEMKRSYLDYAMSVIIGRALPDVRDGLKPVHRRILYSMNEKGLTPGKPYKKSANVVGDVLGAYHPHGDSAVYDSMVRMAQDFSMRYPLIDGQGNWGCFTGDTRVKLLDGTERTFAELAQLPPDEIFFVYSVDASGRIVVGEGRYSRITRSSAELVELTFDDGIAVRCTPDHRFMQRDGSWKQAQELTIDDSLMAGYFDTAQVNEETNDYLRVLQPRTGEYEFVHRLADEFNEQRCRAPKMSGPIAENPHAMRDLTVKAAASLSQKWGNENYARRVMRTKIAGYTSRLIAEVGRDQVTPELYDERRDANWIPNSQKALAYFDSFGEML